MSARRGSAMLRSLLAVLAAFAMLLPAVPVRAATITFANPHATSTFNKGIDFSIEFHASEAPQRLEAQVLFPGATGVFLDPVKLSSGVTQHYLLDTSGSGHLMPNTPVTVTWVAYPQGGGEPVSSAPFTYRYLDETQSWKTLKDDLVTVHWVDGPQSFAQHAASVALKAIKDGAAALSVAETKPVDFFIYADDTSFRAALGPGARENVGGEAITETRTLFAEFTPDMLSDPWVNITITHELTHQIVDDATNNPYRFVPRWINEGFAVYMSEGYASKYRSMVKDAVASGDLLPLTALGWQFPTEPTKTVLGYAEGVSALDYLVRTYGNDALSKLILAYKDGPTDDEAMQAATGLDIAGFQSAWFASIGAPVPSPFGPQPAPPGPLPSDWQGAVATPGPVSSASPAPSTSPAVSSAPTAAAPTPAASADTAPAASSGTDLTLVLVGVVVVAAVVLGGIVLAGRRAST